PTAFWLLMIDPVRATTSETIRASTASRLAGHAPAFASAELYTVPFGAAVKPLRQSGAAPATMDAPLSLRTSDHGSVGGAPPLTELSLLSATKSWVPSLPALNTWIGRPGSVSGPRRKTLPTSATWDGPEPSGSDMSAA